MNITFRNKAARKAFLNKLPDIAISQEGLKLVPKKNGERSARQKASLFSDEELVAFC